MLKQKPLHLLIIFLPLFILLVISVYFANNSWNQYADKQLYSETLADVKLLQDYETAVLNEALCMVLIDKNSRTTSKICDDRINISTALLNELKKEHHLKNWEQQLSLIKGAILDKGINNFEQVLGDKETGSIVKLYLEDIGLDTTTLEEKELVRIYSDLSDISYATALENFLLTYHVSKKIPVSTTNVIFWDKIIQASYLLDLESETDILSVKERLINLTKKDTFHTLLTQIDEMRITILTGNMSINNKSNLDWIVLLEKKQASLDVMKTIIYKQLNLEIEKDTSSEFNIFLLYVATFLLTLAALVALVTVYLQMIRAQDDTKDLDTVINRINALSSFDTLESEEMQIMLNDARNKTDIINYIDSSFQLLHEKKKQSEDNAESKGQFLSTLSHEIRTPLNGIIGFTKLLRDIGVTQDQEEFLSLMEGSSHNLIAIVNDILDLSKMNADKMEIENASFNIVETVESTVATFIQLTDQKDIELGLFIDPFLANYFLGDATKLSQILINLLSNAVKFTDTYGKINVFVQSAHDSKDETEIKFAVHDDGIGFSEEQRKNIFNAFSQATKSTSNEYGGTGLGLTISQKMVMLMGGELEGKSKPDNGSSFYFTLTLKKDKSIEVKTSPDFSDISVGIALPVKGIKRQLDTNLEIYMRYLGAKFSVHYYEDLFEGMGFIDLPDIMIFDHHYARLKGELELCQSLDCKSVLLTNGTLRARIDPQKHHYKDILLRPMSLNKCIRILRNARTNVAPVTQVSTKLKNIESFEGLHALVADDNAVNRKLIKIILEKLGLHVTLSSDGKEVVESYKKERYDIIFMDIQMPIMDGIEATHNILAYEIENKLSHVPIVALTANVANGNKEYYLSEGMDDYATKPLEVDTLKMLISKYCEA